MAANPDLPTMESLLVPIREELHTLRESQLQSDAEIDELQLDAQRAKRPWYRDISVLISFAAVLVSVLSTGFSYYIARQQSIENDKNQLRDVVQRITALNREYNQLLTGEASPNVVYQSGAIATENIILASQAYELIERIPQQLSPVEYTTVADVLSNNGYPERAEELFLRAIQEAQTPKDKAWTQWTYAQFLVLYQRNDQVPQVYQNALSGQQGVVSNYPAALMRNDMWTYLNWGSFEVSQKQCSKARELLEKASQLSVKLALAPNDPFSTQLKNLTGWVAACVE